MSEGLREVTADNLRALRELRFVSVNRSRTRAWGIDSDKWKVEATGLAAIGYERAPGVWDYQCSMEHPRMIEEVEKLLGLDRG